MEWACHSVLQLQRQGHETLGLGTWDKCIEEVPIYRPDEMMGVLIITDETHPLLQRPSFDAPGVKTDKPTHTVEPVIEDDSTGDQDGGQGNAGEQHADQTLDHENTSQRETDISSPENTMLASGRDLGQSSAVSAERADEEEAASPSDTTAAPSVHMDQGPLPTVEMVEERALDKSAVLVVI